MSKVQKLALAGLFIALDIVCARFLSFYLPDPVSRTARISPQFLAHALSAWMLGPLWAAGSAVAGDLLGMAINSGGLSIHLGFTLSSALTGLVYGLVLYRREVRLYRALISVSAVTLLISLFLGSLWMSQIRNLPLYFVILEALPWRLITIPVYTALLFALQNGISRSKVLKS